MTLDNFAPEVWAQEIEHALQKTLVYGQLGIINKNYEGEIAQMGDTVHIVGIGAVTVRDYTKDTDMSGPDAGSDTETTLKIDQAKYFNVYVDSIDRAQSKANIMAALSEEGGYGLKDTMDQFIASLYTDAASANCLGDDTTPKVPNMTAGDAQNVFNLIEDCGTLLSDSHVPRDGRWMILPPWVAALLAKDLKGSYAAVTAEGQQAVTNGFVGRIGGFDLFESPNVPNTSGAKYKVMFGTSRAITFAQQLTEIIPYKPEKRFGDALKCLYLYGAKVVRPDCLGVLTVSKT